MKHQYLKNVVTLKLQPELCNGCTMCTKVCPHTVFIMENKRAKIADINSCMECGACAKNCEQQAISVRSGVGCAGGILTGMLNSSKSKGKNNSQAPVCGTC